MSVEQLSSPTKREAQTVIRTDENYTVDKADDVIDVTTTGVTVRLPPHPLFGEQHTISATGGSVTLNGNGHSIVGSSTVPQGVAVSLLFAADSTWVPVGDAIGSTGTTGATGAGSTGLVDQLQTRGATPGTFAASNWTSPASDPDVLAGQQVHADQAIAAGPSTGFGSSSSAQCLSLGSRLNGNYASGNAFVITGQRRTATAVPPTNSPAATYAYYDSATNRTLYVGGGGWNTPDVLEYQLYLAPTFTETVDTGVLREYKVASHFVWIQPNFGGSEPNPPATNVLGTYQFLNGKARFTCAMVEDYRTDATLSGGTTNNWAPAPGGQSFLERRVLRIDVTAASVLTGLLAGQPGQRILIINAAENVLFTLTLNNRDVGSDAVNRFVNPGLVPLVIPAGGCDELWYDGASLVWRSLSGV